MIPRENVKILWEDTNRKNHSVMVLEFQKGKKETPEMEALSNSSGAVFMDWLEDKRHTPEAVWTRMCQEGFTTPAEFENALAQFQKIEGFNQFACVELNSAIVEF